GAGGQVAACELVLALRACLDARNAARDGEVDRLIVAAFEMQEGVMLDRAPVAPVERVAADEIESAGDVAPAALRHDEKRALGHALIDEAEEFAREIGAAPFAAPCVHVEGEEGVPMVLAEA